MTYLVLGMLLLPGQPLEDVPKVDSARPTPREEVRKRALELFARSLLLERDSDLVQALRELEAARTFDPDAAPIHRALTQLYLALERPEEALLSGARAHELDPADIETAYLHSRQLRNRKRYAEAARVLATTLEKRGPLEPLDRVAQLALDLAMAREEIPDLPGTEAALRQAIGFLENREAMLEGGRIREADLRELTADAQERLALVCTRQKKDTAALAAFAQARKLDPVRGPRLNYHLALLHEQHGRFEEGLAAVEDYLRIRPPGTEAHELKVRLLHGLGRGREALAFLEHASRNEMFQPGLPVLLANEYVRTRRLGKARQVLRQALKTHPTREIARALVERYCAEPAEGDALFGMLDELLTAAGDRDPKQPGDPNAAAQARVLLAAIQRNAAATTLVLQAMAQRLPTEKLGEATATTLADLAARANQLDLAERLYRTALRLLGQGRPIEHDLYGGLLRVLRQGNKHAAIVTVCREGLVKAEATNRVLFHSYLARAQLALGRTREALQAADDAVNESSDRHRLSMRRNRALILAEAGQVSAAVAECHALLREYNQPADVTTVRHALASIWSIGKQPARALEQLKLVVQADPTDATALNDLAYQYAETNQELDRAEKLARKAIELDRRQRNSGTQVDVDGTEDNGSFIDTLGWVLFRQGKLEPARKELQRAVELPGGKDSAVIWDHLGDVLARLGETEAARLAFKRSLELYEAEGRRRADETTMAEIRKKLQLLQP